MNREILFRGKEIGNNVWVVGNALIIKNKAYIVVDAETTGLDGENTGLYAKEWYEVNPDTLCQYTGLTDRNGKKIWENDICDRKEEYPEIVRHIEGDWMLDYSYARNREEGFACCNLGFYVLNRWVEVVGNVFDNQELLEVNK